MKLKVLGASGSHSQGLYTTSLLLNERILVDAGTGVTVLDADTINQVGDVVLTHSHLDHTLMMCLVADGRIGGKNGHGLRVHCLEETANAVRRGMLNGEIWPDFEHIVLNEVPLMEFNVVKPFVDVHVGGVRITPLPVVHSTVPTLGYCFHGDRSDFVFISDIIEMPPETMEYINGIGNLHAMTLEVSFVEGQEELAKASGHLTPLMFEDMLVKLPPNVKVYYCHLKTSHREQIIEQMQRRFGDRVAVLEQQLVFDF